jgi:hypothetical protein
MRTKRMNLSQLRKFSALSLCELRRLKDGITVLIQEIEQGERREIDIASEHTGARELSARVLRVIGDPSSGKWEQIERIYCSLERCPRCPHGDFRYRYQRDRRRGSVSVRYIGTMALSHETVEHLREGICAGMLYEIKNPSPPSKGMRT